MYYLKDPTTKEPSPTLTMMFLGVGAALLKLIVAGSTIVGIKFGEFSGVDFAAVVSPLFALYGHKRTVISKDKIKVIEAKAPKKAPQ